MSENNTQQETELNKPEFESNFDINFDSNQDSVRLEPIFPITRTEAGKFLGKSDVAIGKALKKLADAYSVKPEKMFGLTDEKGKITEWGFNELIKLHRHTSPSIPDYDRQTGKIYWDWEGKPTEMMDNPARINVDDYLTQLTQNLLENTDDDIVKNTGLEIVPVEMDVEAINLTAHSKKQTGIETMKRVASIQQNTSARYLNMRAMRRRNIAAQALQDSAEDAELYAKVYDANISKMLNDQASGLDSNDVDE